MISVSGRDWEQNKINKNSVEKLKQDYNFSDIVSKLIISRKFDETELNSINNNLHLNNVFLKNEDFEKSIKIVIDTINSNSPSSKLWEKAKETISQVKDKWVELVKNNWIHTLVEKLKNSDSIFDNLLGFLLGLVAMILPSKDVTEDIKDNVDEITNPEKRKEHINKINEFTPKLVTSIEKKLNIQHPILKEKINNLINQPEIINEQQLETLIKELEAGKPFSLQLLQETLNENQYAKLKDDLTSDPEIKEALKLKLEKTLVDHFSGEYWISLHKEKREKLHKLVQKHFTNFSFWNLFERFMDNQAVTGFDLVWAMFDDWEKAMVFNFSLVTEWIIGFSQLTFNIINKGWELIQVGLSWLWVTGELSFENFAKQLENLWDDERRMILAVLYRKWGIALDIWAKILWTLSKSLLELISPSTLSFTDEVKNFMWNTNSQINSYQKLVWIVTDGQQDELIKEAVKSVERVATQTKIADILDNAESLSYTEIELKADFDKLMKDDFYDKDILRQLEWIDYTPWKGIQSIRAYIAQSIQFNYSWVDKLKSFSLGILPGQHNFARDLESSLENISSFQTSRIRSWKWWMKIYKAAQWVRSSFEQMNVTTKFDKLVFESGNLWGIRDSLSEMKRFATQFPDQAKMAFGAIGEIAMIGISIQMMEEDKSVSQEIFDNLLYMTGFIWSWYMLLSIGWIKNKETWELDVVNAGLSAAGWALLLLDWARTVKIITLNWFTLDAGKKILTDVVWRPVTNLVKWVTYTGKWAYNATRALASLSSEVAAGKFDLGKLKSTISKNFHKSKKKIWFLLWLWAAWIAWVSYAMEWDISWEYEEMIELWIIDKDGKVLDKQKAKKYFNDEFSDEEKRIFIELILNNNEYIEIWNNIKITDITDNNIVLEANKNIQKWCIEPEQKQMLENFGYQISFA